MTRSTALRPSALRLRSSIPRSLRLEELEEVIVSSSTVLSSLSKEKSNL